MLKYCCYKPCVIDFIKNLSTLPNECFNPENPSLFGPDLLLRFILTVEAAVETMETRSYTATIGLVIHSAGKLLVSINLC